MDIIGRGSLVRLGEQLRAGEEVVVFTRESIVKRHGKLLNEQLAQVHPLYYTAIEPNPTREQVADAQRALGGKSPAYIVAIGGGSVLDFAKAWRHYEGSSAPLIAVPTTAGTGSEATQFAVIYINGSKVSLDSPELLPEVAIIDSALTEAAPRSLKASCAMDAYCQAIESYWARAATEESRAYALEAIALCRECLVAAVNSTEAYANEQLARASHMAGKAINISRTTAAHALSYRITSQYGVPHGHAVALSIAGLFEKNMTAIPDLPRLLAAMGIEADGVREHFDKLMHAVGLAASTAALGITNVEELADAVNPQRLANNPILLSRDDLVEILH